MKFKKICFIVNPASGQPKPVLHSINHALRDYSVEWDVKVTTLQHDAKEMAQSAVKQGFDLIVACGGDGTVKGVSDGIVGKSIAGKSIPLGILHGGTGNALARWLKIPADIEEATKLLVSDHDLKPVDLGRVSTVRAPKKSGCFLLRVSIGLQHTIMTTASRELKDRFGNLAYVMASLQSLTSGDSSKVAYTLTIDGEKVEAEGVMCMIANSASVGAATTFEFAPNVDPTDGLLDVFVFGADLPSLMAAFTSALRGDEAIFSQRWRGKSIKVETKAKQPITVDGEELGMQPFTATVDPGALRVVVPKASA